VSELGLPERVRALLEEQGVKADVWDGVEVEPTDRSMVVAHQADAVLGLELAGVTPPGEQRLIGGVVVAVQAEGRRVVR